MKHGLKIRRIVGTSIDRTGDQRVSCPVTEVKTNNKEKNKKLPPHFNLNPSHLLNLLSLRFHWLMSIKPNKHHVQKTTDGKIIFSAKDLSCRLTHRSESR